MSDAPLTPSSISSGRCSFIDRVDLGAIAALATAARSQTSGGTVSCSVNPLPKVGAFNIVWFIQFDDQIRWILRTPIAEWTPVLEKRMRSNILGMQLIQARTKVPIPTIHGFSLVPDNALGRPYVLMDHAKGTQLCDLWFDPIWFTDERRNTVGDFP